MTVSYKFSLIALVVGCLFIMAGASQAAPLGERTDVVTAGGKPVTLKGREIKVGDKAPDFTALDRQRRPVSLSDYSGKVRIISVFPSIDTKVCPIQVRTFNKRAAELEDVQVLAISVDLPFALERFCAAEGIDNIATLSDHRETEFGLKYGFLIDEMRLLARGTVIVDQQGIVRYVEYVPELSSEPDYDKALETAKKLAAAS
jgi:thiol peroxidase